MFQDAEHGGRAELSAQIAVKDSAISKFPARRGLDDACEPGREGLVGERLIDELLCSCFSRVGIDRCIELRDQIVEVRRWKSLIDDQVAVIDERIAFLGGQHRVVRFFVPVPEHGGECSAFYVFRQIARRLGLTS